MKPALKYYGGKQRQSAILMEIVNLFPHHLYAEHYAGGAALLFAKESSKLEVLNDHDERIVNFYRVAKSQTKQLLAMIVGTPYSESEYYRSKKLLNSTDKLEKAWALYIQLHQSFSANIGGGWSRGKTRNSNTLTYNKKIDTLELILMRLKNVQISNRDAIENIQIFDSPAALHYCDPPYPGCNQGHYAGFTIDDFQKLVACLDQVKGAFILSNYEQNIPMPKDWQRCEWKTTKVASRQNRNKATEIVWYRGPK